MFNAVILCGGLGTRLKSVVNDIPKPMAQINGKPFLEYILNYLSKTGIVSKFILCVGYKYEKIQDYFGSSYNEIPIKYSIESTPLGTGGAVRKALEIVDGKEFLLLNGDSIFQIDISKLFIKYSEAETDIVMALKKMHDFDRYGSVEILNDSIIEFKEKMFIKEGYINGGIYLIRKDIFNKYDLPEKFSFEKDVLEKHVNSLCVKGIFSEGYFIDIGIPEDYKKAQLELNLNYI